MNVKALVIIQSKSIAEVTTGLEALGFEVHATMRSADGISWAAENHPDLWVVADHFAARNFEEYFDIKKDGTGSWTVKPRGNAPWGATPIIISNGSYHPRRDAAAAEAELDVWARYGVAGVVFVPFLQNDLKEVVENALASRSHAEKVRVASKHLTAIIDRYETIDAKPAALRAVASARLKLTRLDVPVPKADLECLVGRRSAFEIAKWIYEDDPLWPLGLSGGAAQIDSVVGPGEITASYGFGVQRAPSADEIEELKKRVAKWTLYESGSCDTLDRGFDYNDAVFVECESDVAVVVGPPPSPSLMKRLGKLLGM